MRLVPGSFCDKPSRIFGTHGDEFGRTAAKVWMGRTAQLTPPAPFNRMPLVACAHIDPPPINQEHRRAPMNGDKRGGRLREDRRDEWVAATTPVPVSMSRPRTPAILKSQTVVRRRALDDATFPQPFPQPLRRVGVRLSITESAKQLKGSPDSRLRVRSQFANLPRDDPGHNDASWRHIHYDVNYVERE